MRDPAFEHEMVVLAVEGAERVYHAAPSHFERAVNQRLAMGETRYRGSYRDRDCLSEAMEEPSDACAWLLLDLQKAREGLGEREAAELAQAALPALSASAAAYAALEQYRALRDEVGAGC